MLVSLVSALALTIVASTALPPGLPAYVAPAAVRGTLHCAGGETMTPLTTAWATAFMARMPGTQVDLDGVSRLSADGFAALLDGRVDCVTFVREPFPAERAAFAQRFGHELRPINVAGGSFAVRGGTHAIAIFVNAANPLAQLDLQQLDAILSSSRRRGASAAIVRWGQLGLAGDWTNRPVHVYSMLRGRETGNPPGIVNFMQHRVLLDAPLRDDVREQRDVPGESALQAIVHRVASDPAGIGYSGFGFGESGVKALSLAETAAGPFVAGTHQTVADRSYPLCRDIYVLVAGGPNGEPTAVGREFLRFVLSREGQQIVADDPHGFLPLTARQADAARAGIVLPTAKRIDEFERRRPLAELTRP